MAVVFNGTKNSLNSKLLPSGYVVPTVTEITPEYSFTKTLTVLKSTVENATASTTMTNIFTNATIGLNKQITDLITAEFNSASAVTAHADLKSLTTNIASLAGSGDWLKNTAVSYVATVDVYVNVA